MIPCWSDKNHYVKMVIDLETSSVEGKIQEDLKAFLTLFRGDGDLANTHSGGERRYIFLPHLSRDIKQLSWKLARR